MGGTRTRANVFWMIDAVPSSGERGGGGHNVEDGGMGERSLSLVAEARRRNCMLISLRSLALVVEAGIGVVVTAGTLSDFEDSAADTFDGTLQGRCSIFDARYLLTSRWEGLSSGTLLKTGLSS